MPPQGVTGGGLATNEEDVTTHIEQSLEQAVDGLLYPSESEEPFEVICWADDGKPIDASRLLEQAGYKPHIPVTETSLDDFFKDLTTVQSWYGDNEKANTQRFRDLEDMLRHSLTDIRVFRVGEVRIDVYIIGVTGDGGWAGVKTTSVET